MNGEIILLKKSPKIEFQFLENGIQLFDEQTKQNSGFYAYNELQSIELDKLWFPRLAKLMRVLTSLINCGIPFFPEADSYKKAKIVFQFKNTKFGMWLTDGYMVDKAKKLKFLYESNCIK